MKSLSESQSRQILTGYGLPVPKEQSVASADDAVAFAASLGGPAAIKADRAGLAHKTESGLVALGIEGTDAVKAAGDRILAAAPEGSRLVVQEMVTGRRELMLGMKRDDQWGPVLSLGLGGIFAEALADVTLRLAPVTEAEAAGMLDDLRGAEMFGNWRGLGAVDRRMLATAIISVGQCAVENPEIAEIDVNPLIVTDNGEVFAVDTLVVQSDG